METDERSVQSCLDHLTSLMERTDKAVDRLRQELQEVRQERFKPYLATSGAFLTLILAAVGYIYSMEIRLREDVAALSALIQEADQQYRAVNQRHEDMRDRMLAYSQHQTQVWATHANRHATMDDTLKLLAKQLLGDH